MMKYLLLLIATVAGTLFTGDLPAFAVQGAGQAHTRAGPAAAAAPAASVRQSDQGDWDAGLLAALAAYNGVARAQGDSCTAGNPGHQTCVFADPTAEAVATAHRGLFTFGIGDAEDAGGAFILFGRTSDGAWDQWFGTQNIIYQPISLPGEARVCADGDGLNVRQAPSVSAPVARLLPDGTTLIVEEFVLTQAQPYDEQGRRTGRGDGWYRVSGPADGWVNYHYISSTRLADCSIRDAFERFNL
jgi:Bacterial SH3 domain